MSTSFVQREGPRRRGRRIRVLLLNPPSPTPVFRDGYCSDRTKGPFSIHPLDLQVQSGYFADEPYELEYLDAAHERLSPSRTRDRIRAFSPHVILSLIGEAVYENDTAFLESVSRAIPGVRLFLSGDLARFSPQRVFRDMPFAEGLLADFTTPGLIDHLEGRPTPHLIVPGENPAPPPAQGVYSHPRPARAFVTRYRHQLPFFREPTFYSLLGSFGCPYKCAYCNTHRLGYAVREIDPFIDEMSWAKELGYRSLYIRDATFFVDKERTDRLLERWEQSGHRFEWICFTRPELFDEEIAARAARIGCRTVLIGVESFDEDILRETGRDGNPATVENAFRAARRHGIDTAAMIMVGLETLREAYASPRELMARHEKSLSVFLDRLDPDYLSLNVYHKRPGIEAALPALTRIDENRKDYQAMANRLARRYYLRPRRLARRIALVRNPRQLLLLLKIAARLILKAS